MAKMPWEKYATVSGKIGWKTKKSVRAKAPGKAPRDKLLEQVDLQIGYLDKKDVGKKAWFKPHPDGDVVKCQVRYGNTPLKLSGDATYLEMSIEALSQFLADIRDAVAAGKFDGQLDEISARMSARRTKG